MLHAALLALPLACPPLLQGAPPQGATPPKGAVSVGCNHPKWLARNVINKQLVELSGYPLYEAYWKTVAWLGERAVPGAGVASEGGRDVGATALVALVMMGTGSNVQAGAGKLPLRTCLRALRGWQDEESGAIGDPEAPEFLLDHTLALLALGEANFSDDVPAQEVASRKAAEALLAARGEDGLWHVGAQDDAPVDPLVTALGGYALFVGREAELDLPDEAFERVLAWTDTVAARAAEVEPDALGREDAVLFAAGLCARLFTAAALERSLAGDEGVAELARRLGALVPAPPVAGEEWTAPTRLAEPDFAALAMLALYQADNAAWGRGSRWLAEMFLADIVTEGDEAGAFLAGVTGRFPGGTLGATALRMLGMQSGVRELSLSVLVQ